MSPSKYPQKCTVTSGGLSWTRLEEEAPLRNKLLLLPNHGELQGYFQTSKAINLCITNIISI